MPKTKEKPVPSQEFVAAFEKEEPLTWADVKCQICFSIFVEPVTFPCKHSFCLHCFKKFIRDTSLFCPCCHRRLSNWSRPAIKENNLVNEPFSERIKAEFPKELAKRLKELEEENDDDSEEPKNGLTIKDDSGFRDAYDEDENSQNDCPKVRDGEFAPPGELAKELTQIYSKHQMELDEERRRRVEQEEEASKQFIKEILRNEGRETSSLLELDLQMAQMLVEQENEKILLSGPRTRRQRKAIESPAAQLQIMKPEPKSKLNGKASTNLLKGVSKASKRRHSHTTNTSSSSTATSKSKIITSTRVKTVTIPSSPDDVVVIGSGQISPSKSSNPANLSQSSSWSLGEEIPGGSQSSDNQSQNLPQDQVELYRMEEEELKKYRLKILQEEEDRQFAKQIQKSGENVREYRGRGGDGRYSIRNWTKSINK